MGKQLAHGMEWIENHNDVSFVDFELFFYLFAVGCVVPGAGAFEIAAHASLTALKETVSTRARLGVQVRNLSDT